MDALVDFLKKNGKMYYDKAQLLLSEFCGSFFHPLNKNVVIPLSWVTLRPDNWTVKVVECNQEP